MKTILEKTAKQMAKSGRTSSIMICTRKNEEQLQYPEKIARTILPIPKDRSYKTHPDVFGIWPENIEGKNIKIKQIHEFIRKTQLRPYVGDSKVGIIISAEKMTKEAQNALLKTLEEPPERTFLILTCSNKSQIIDTIVSRCKIFESFKYEDEEVDLVTIKKLVNSNIIERFKYIEEFLNKTSKSKSDQLIAIQNFLINLLTYFRQQLLKKLGKENQVLEIINLIEKTRVAIESNVNKRLALENLMINLPLKGVDY